ncbi:hypothetical protein V6O07_19900, partial [Arthrospira platensis SPKY2]
IGFGLFAFALAVLKSVRESHGITTTDRVTEVTEEPAPDVEEEALQAHMDDADHHHDAQENTR